MNRPQSSRAKVHLFKAISFLALTAGVVCIGFAVMKISASAVEPTDTYTNISPIQPDLGARRMEPASAGPRPMVTDTPSDTSDINLYPIYPIAGDTIGSMSIPALDLNLPIIQGTGADDLEKGIGHFVQSVLPGEKDNCVLSGHRDTVFTRLGELKAGDQMIVQTSAGTFTYEISGTRIVDKDDKTVIVPTDHAVLTVTTCYPFIFIGHAPDRYIVSADLVASSNAE
jgi:sortase A